MNNETDEMGTRWVINELNQITDDMLKGDGWINLPIKGKIESWWKHLKHQNKLFNRDAAIAQFCIDTGRLERVVA